MYQETIRARQPAGIIGEFAVQGPTRVTPFAPEQRGIREGDTVASPYIIGRGYTFSTVEPGKVVLGFDGDGTGSPDAGVTFAGVPISPKEYIAEGDGIIEAGAIPGDDFVGSGLGVLRPNAVAQLCTMGEPWLPTYSPLPAAVPGAADPANFYQPAPGQPLFLHRTTGAIAAFPAGSALGNDWWQIPGAIMGRLSSAVPGTNVPTGSWPEGRLFIARFTG